MNTSLEKSYLYRHHINNDFEMHKQVKANDIMSLRYGDLLTSLSSMASILIRLQRCIQRDILGEGRVGGENERQGLEEKWRLNTLCI